jgi:cytochrome c556
MKRVRSAAMLVAAVAMVTGSVVATSAPAAQQSIKQLMGDNFSGLQKILVALIDSNYKDVPAEAEVIRDHAMKLTKEVPASAQARKDEFLALAFALQSHAESLKSISELLMKHDIEQMAKSGNMLATDELRASLAGHYGAMVVTCVTCHNEFRHHQVGAP